MPIPTWDEAQKAVQSGTPTALEIFVYDYEPSDEVRAREFRLGLQTLMDSIADIHTIDKINKPKG